MQTVQKGLHGINAKIPQVVLKRDFVAFSLQIFSLFACIISAVAWVVFGFDSTVEGVIGTIQGKANIEMGNGTHISTLLNFFLITFLLSNYLSKKEIIGFHNLLVSIFIPITAFMAFEFPWVILTDYFHNRVVEGAWSTTLYGIGRFDLGTLMIGLIIIPSAIFYLCSQFFYERLTLSPRASINFSSIIAMTVALLMVGVSLAIGTLTILIRNTFALFFFAFANATLKDATKNFTISELVGKYSFKQRVKGPLIAILAAVAVFAVWIWWPYFTQIKGSMWPQTMYTFYFKDGPKAGLVDYLEYVPNAAVHAFNVVSKALVTAGISLALIPKIVVRK